MIEKEEEGSPRVISAFEVSVSQTLLRIVYINGSFITHGEG